MKPGRIAAVAAGFAATAAAVVAVVAWAGVSGSEFADAFWPAGIVAVLAVIAVAASLALVVLVTRRRRVSPQDQALLDQILHVLNRQSIRLIREHDFYDSWPVTLLHPVTIFVNEFCDVEHKFKDTVLEEKRKDLYEKAVAFEHAERANGWRHEFHDARRNPGMTIGETEMDQAKSELLTERAEAIRSTAFPYCVAHDALVETAKNHGYDVGALNRDRHPRVRDLDEIYEPRASRSWVDSQAPAWPAGPGPAS